MLGHILGYFDNKVGSKVFLNAIFPLETNGELLSNIEKTPTLIDLYNEGFFFLLISNFLKTSSCPSY